MNKIPKCRTKYVMPQPNNIRPAPKDHNKEYLVQKITQKSLKFRDRQFGKDLTNTMKGNIQNNYNNHTTKIVKIVDRNSINNIYIKKHSSSSQASQKTKKLKISINNTKLRENKSGSMLNKKSDISASENYFRINNNTKYEYASKKGRTKLRSSISFGINNNIRPFSSNNNNSIFIRISNPKRHKICNNINNRNMNINSNNKYYNRNMNRIEKIHSNFEVV